MKLGRILRASFEGDIARLVVAQPEHNRVIDLVTAEYDRLLRESATAEAARRLASALFPASMAAAIGSGLCSWLPRRGASRPFRMNGLYCPWKASPGWLLLIRP